VPAPSDFAEDVAGLSPLSDFSDDFSDEVVVVDDFSSLSAFFRDSEG
jgi:hypothetical protein